MDIETLQFIYRALTKEHNEQQNVIIAAGNRYGDAVENNWSDVKSLHKRLDQETFKNAKIFQYLHVVETIPLQELDS